MTSFYNEYYILNWCNRYPKGNVSEIPINIFYHLFIIQILRCKSTQPIIIFRHNVTDLHSPFVCLKTNMSVCGTYIKCNMSPKMLFVSFSRRQGWQQTWEGKYKRPTFSKFQQKVILFLQCSSPQRHQPRGLCCFYCQHINHRTVGSARAQGWEDHAICVRWWPGTPLSQQIPLPKAAVGS